MKSGKVSYRAQIRLTKNGVTVHQESETFDSKTLAKAWATKREAELSEITRLEWADNDDCNATG